MDNFKEIAEKCLSGELSGTFILKAFGSTRYKKEVSSDQLTRSGYSSFLYRLGNIDLFNSAGRSLVDLYVYDFIPDNMKEVKEIKIEVPEGYEVDKENSTFEKIVFKRINDGYPKNWEELRKVQINCYHIMNNVVYKCPRSSGLFIDDKDSYPTRELAEASLALSQLLHFRAAWIHQWSIDEGMSEDWEPNWSNCAFSPISVITRRISYDDPGIKYSIVNNNRSNVDPRMLSFPDKVLAYKFLDTFKDLIEQAKDLI